MISTRQIQYVKAAYTHNINTIVYVNINKDLTIINCRRKQYLSRFNLIIYISLLFCIYVFIYIYTYK